MQVLGGSVKKGYEMSWQQSWYMWVSATTNSVGIIIIRYQLYNVKMPSYIGHGQVKVILTFRTPYYTFKADCESKTK